MLGWNASDWRALPDVAYQEFATVANLCEEEGWPPQILEAWTALVPKESQRVLHDEGTLVSDLASLRPIAVESTVLRVWSGARFAKMRGALETRVAPCQYGMTAGKSTTDAVARAAVATSCDGQPWQLVLFDFSKCFDTLPTHILSGCLERMGVSRAPAERLQRHLGSIKRRFKLPLRAVSPPIQAGRGVVQGDALSVLAAQVLLAPLAWKLQAIMDANVGKVVATAYQDDVLVASTEPALLDELVRIVQQYAKDFSIEINESKTVVLDFAGGQ
eukprot:2515200-Amphidinium_carterae.1